MIDNFFESICFYMEPVPQAWGALHLSYLLIGFAVSFMAAFLLRKCSLRVFNNILRTIGISLIVMEIFKISYNYYALCDNNFSSIVYLFPFQLCSLPIYMAFIASFLKQGNSFRNAMLSFMMSYTFMSGLIAYFEPSGLLNPTYFSTFHSLTWHMLLVFLGLLIGFSVNVEKNVRNFRHAFYLFLVCCGIALVLNYTLPLIMPDKTASVPNMLYIGPARSSLIVYKDIFDMFGWIVQAIAYVLSVSAAAFLFYLPFMLKPKVFAKKVRT